MSVQDYFATARLNLYRKTAPTDSQIKQIIGQVLTQYFNEPAYLNLGDNILVTDSIPEKGIYMLHYADNANFAIFGRIRGVIVDITDKVVVADSYGTITMTEILEDTFPVPVEGQYRFQNNHKLEITLQADRTVFKYGFEGAIVRMIYYKGLQLTVTHRRLSLKDANYVDVPSFEILADYLGLPKHEELFDLLKESSIYYYTFMLIDNRLLNVTRMRVANGMVIYMGYKKMNWAENLEETSFNVDLEVKVPECSEKLLPINQQPYRYAHMPISANTAKKFINSGFYEFNKFADSIDVRQIPGESIFAIEYNEENEIVKIVRICSPSYMWRFKIRNNNVNLTKQFYYWLKFTEYGTLLPNGNYQRFYIDKYLEHFMMVQYYDPVDIINKINKLMPSHSGLMKVKAFNINLIRNTTNFAYQVWINMMMAIPLYQQYKFMYQLGEYNRLIVGMTEHIFENLLMLPSEELDRQHVTDRMIYIINQVNNHSDIYAKYGVDGAQIIDLILRKENGWSLYQMFLAMKPQAQIEIIESKVLPELENV